MATVPRYRPDQETATPQPGNNFGTSMSPSIEGGNIEAMQTGLKASEQAIKKSEDAFNEMNRAKVKVAEGEMTVIKQKLQTAISNLKGEDALKARDYLDKDFRDATGKIRSEMMTNSQQKAMFDDIYSKNVVELDGFVEQHLAKEMTEYKKESNLFYEKTQKDFAIFKMDNDAEWVNSMTAGKNNAIERSADEGNPNPEMAGKEYWGDGLYNSVDSKLTIGTSGIIPYKQALEEAWLFYDKHKDDPDLLEEDRTRILKLLSSHSRRAAGGGAVDDPEIWREIKEKELAMLAEVHLGGGPATEEYKKIDFTEPRLWNGLTKGTRSAFATTQKAAALGTGIIGENSALDDLNLLQRKAGKKISRKELLSRYKVFQTERTQWEEANGVKMDARQKNDLADDIMLRPANKIPFLNVSVPGKPRYKDEDNSITDKFAIAQFNKMNISRRQKIRAYLEKKKMPSDNMSVLKTSNWLRDPKNANKIKELEGIEE